MVGFLVQVAYLDSLDNTMDYVDNTQDYVVDKHCHLMQIPNAVPLTLVEVNELVVDEASEKNWNQKGAGKSALDVWVQVEQTSYSVDPFVESVGQPLVQS